MKRPCCRRTPTRASWTGRGANQLVASVRQSGRTIMTEVESKALLAAYGIPIVPTKVAQTAAEAAVHRRRDGLSRRAQDLFRDHHA